MAEVCNVDEAFPSVSGFGCGFGSGSTILGPPDAGGEAPLGAMDQLIDLCFASSVDNNDFLPDECDSVYGEFPNAGAVGFAVAPGDGPPFQLCCLLLYLLEDDAISFECACRDHLGVQPVEVP